MVKKNQNKLTSLDVEVAIARLFNPRRHIIVPNISWGAFVHECDMLIIKPSGYATEVEIKISKADLKKDFKKKHDHKSEKIKELYYAVPLALFDFAKELLPKHVGIITCDKYQRDDGSWNTVCSIKRAAKNEGYYRKLDKDEMLNIARLGCMRIWNLKQKMLETKHPPEK